MKVGVIGLGLMGYPIASSLHTQGHEVISWTQKSRVVPWVNSTSFSSYQPRELDFLIVASGSARPAFGDVRSEIISTYDLVSNHFEKNGTRIIYLSSGAVYGECTNAKTEDDLINPTSEYGLAKFVAEQAFFSRYEENFCSLRIGNVIDWNSPYGVLQAMSNAISEHRMVFYGNPTDCRDYVSIQDLTLTISKIINSKTFPNILNVGSGIEVRLSELAAILIAGLDARIEITWREIGVGQLKQTKLNILKLKSEFDITPKNPKEIFAEYLINEHS